MRKSLWFSLILSIFLAVWGFAQDISGSIAGTVLDPSSAAVPNAKVTITNTDQNRVIRTVTTGVDGNYSAPLLPVGTYSIKVEANGFKVATRDGIKLNVNDALSVNMPLQLGASTEQVTVAESPVAVELGSPANTGLMESRQIRELSVSTRNYEQLVALMPGVSTDNVDQLFIGNVLPSGQANTMPFSVNGQRNSANNWTVDGADNVDRGSNLTLLNYPSIDAIDQFKVQRSMYTADSGRAGGAQIAVVTKSGTSQFHGDAYEFVRNDAFVANNWINNANKVNVINGVAVAPPLRWNDFGFTFGGPVYIPGHYNKDKNKTFFFYSQEFRRIIQYATFTSTVPTANERQGIFSVPVCTSNSNPCTATSTQITTINPVAQAYIKDIIGKIPVPSSGNTLNYLGRNVFNHRQEMARIDHNFNEKFQLWGRVLWDTIPTKEPAGIFSTSVIPGVANTESNSPGHSIVGHAVYTVKPTMVNEAGYDYSYGAYLSSPVGLTAKTNATDINPTLLYPNTLGVVTALAFTGGSSIVGVGPYIDYNTNHSAFDNFTWIKGAHTLKFGMTLNNYRKHENSANGNNYGTFSFTNTGAPTGTGSFQQSFANFLLGNISTYSQASKDFTADVHAWQWEAFAQDDFRVSSRLTLYAGLRWSFFGQPWDGNNVLSNFDPLTFNHSDTALIDSTGLCVVAQCPTASGKTYNGMIFGGNGSPFGSKVSNDNWRNFAPRIGLAWDPFGDQKTSVRAGYGIYYDSGLFGTYEQNIFTNPPLISTISISSTNLSNPPGGTAAAASRAPLVLRGTPLPNMTPYTQQWSFDVQRQIQNNLVLDVGYFGSKGTHLLGIIDINQIPPGLGIQKGLLPATGTIFVSTGDEQKLNQIRPFPGYNAINVVEPWFDSNYHSLQASIRKDFGEGGLFTASYTWSKNLTDNASDRSNAPQNTYNFHDGEYGPARLDRRQVLTLNYVYNLPFFKRSHGALAYALGGWELSGNTQYGTGLPYTVATSSADPGGLGLLGSSASAARPDQVCDPNVDAPHQFGAAAQNLLWFNTACFQPVPQGTIRPGNAGRFTIRGPGYGKWDVSLFKNFHFTERFYVQLRGEAFNVFNHANPSGIGSLNNTSSLFGKITTFRDPRILQLAAKLYF